jgi:hypothetical protein
MVAFIRLVKGCLVASWANCSVDEIAAGGDRRSDEIRKQRSLYELLGHLRPAAGTPELDLVFDQLRACTDPQANACMELVFAHELGGHAKASCEPCDTAARRQYFMTVRLLDLNEMTVRNLYDSLVMGGLLERIEERPPQGRVFTEVCDF